MLNREIMSYEKASERLYLRKMKTLITFMLSKRTKIYGDEKERMKHFYKAFHALADGVDCHFRAREEVKNKKMLLETERHLKLK